MPTTSLHRLIALYERARAAESPAVLATVIRTAGSTYAKPGAHMLIAADGEYAGLLSGGCLEGDLREHARRVQTTGAAQIVSYDMRTPDDQLFGLGAGCEGAMDILLVRVGPLQRWQPLASMVECYRDGAAFATAFVTATRSPQIALGAHLLPDTPALQWLPAARQAVLTTTSGQAPRFVEPADAAADVFVVPLELPPRVLVAGAGPDTRPLAELAHFLGWRVTLADHRAAYTLPELFPTSATLIQARPEELSQRARLSEYDAAVVMSHHLQSDLEYLRALAAAEIPYVGLLGPAARREKLLSDLGAEAAGRLRARLRAPIGLDIGGRAAESIALSIVSEIHAFLSGRAGRPFSQTAVPPPS